MTETFGVRFMKLPQNHFIKAAHAIPVQDCLVHVCVTQDLHRVRPVLLLARVAKTMSCHPQTCPEPEHGSTRKG
eukprot:scaffold148015_cov21-Tisochrysis_lutea.AAC.2